MIGHNDAVLWRDTSGANRVGTIAVLVTLGVVGALGWARWIDTAERHEMDGLSCTSDSFMRTAVDFAGVPTWPDARAALDYAFEVDRTIPTDGWELSLEDDSATWERHDGAGHLVGLSVHRRVGAAWGFSLPIVCEEIRVDHPDT